MPTDSEVTLHLSISDVLLLIEGLDAYEYWQLGDVLPRNNGAVFIPGDLDPEFDHYWGPEPQPSAAQAEAIDQVRTCRALSKRLTAARNQATKD
jgi:hypothetical protein